MKRKKTLTQPELVALLKKQAQEVPQNLLAKQLGVSPQYLGDILRGDRLPGKKILDGMGYERIVLYRPKSQA